MKIDVEYTMLQQAVGICTNKTKEAGKEIKKIFKFSILWVIFLITELNNARESFRIK